MGSKYIKVNAIECLGCGTPLISLHRHDYKACKCGAMTDGGFDYIRRAEGGAGIRELPLYWKKE